jgi:glycosyltransferase involved in cell wall biosynthesis
MMPKIALCIPAYNAAQFLPRLIASAHAQSSPFDEVLVYDDASTDDTAAVCEGLGVRLIRGITNLGPSVGKNALLNLISADWVHFHDADDVLSPDFVRTAKLRILEEKCDVLLMNYQQIHGETGHMLSRSNFELTSVCEDPVQYCLSHTINAGGVYRVDFVRRSGGFDIEPAARYNEDRAYHLRLATSGARFAVDSYLGCTFYFRENSMSSGNLAKCSRAQQYVTEAFHASYVDQYVDQVVQLSWHNATALASFLDWSGADHCVAFALRLAPRSVPVTASAPFRKVCRIAPFTAMRMREYAIRILKPGIRSQRYPQVFKG